MKESQFDHKELFVENHAWRYRPSSSPELMASLTEALETPLAPTVKDPSQDEYRHDPSLDVRDTLTEHTPLLCHSSISSSSSSLSSSIQPDRLDETWHGAVAADLIYTTTWQAEAAVVFKYAAPLILTFFLEYSLTFASIFAVGRIGKVELGAVSLASMTANITGYGVYEGWTTALDTLCAQAYGSGRKDLMGLHTQRMILFTWALTLPIGIIWYNASWLLKLTVPDVMVCDLAGQYLRIVFLGAPGFAAFASGKRFMQAQGLFQPGMWVLLICAPLNALMNYAFVWKLGLGFVGAAMAVAITNNLMPLCLLGYAYFVDGMQCWGGFSRDIITNWGLMFRLALPGFLMLEAGLIAFEILALSASWLGTTALAAQSILASLIAITFQIPLPLSIAGSTRVANLIGAGLVAAARRTFLVMLVFGLIIGAFNLTLLSALRNHIPYLFTSDDEVAALVSHVIPICASFQIVDALSTICDGTLRGLGRQKFGGWAQIVCYYAVALPLSFICAFTLQQGLRGTWAGIAIGLSLVSGVELVYLHKFDWEQAAVEAHKRNMA